MKKFCKVEKHPFIPKRKVWELNERDIEEHFATNFENVTQRVNVEDHVEDLKSFNNDFLVTKQKTKVNNTYSSWLEIIFG